MKLTNRRPITCLITRGNLTAENFTEKSRETVRIAKVAADLGITLIQVREKTLPTRLIVELTSEITEICLKSDTLVLVNDRADVAVAAGAYGVHLTSKSLPTKIVRRDFGNQFMIGVSAHSVADVVDAQATGGNFALLGSVFASPGKEDKCGLAELKEACERVGPFPVLAVGGINDGNYLEVLVAGASGFAAIRAMNDEKLLRKIAAKLSNTK